MKTIIKKSIWILTLVVITGFVYSEKVLAGPTFNVTVETKATKVPVNRNVEVFKIDIDNTGSNEMTLDELEIESAGDFNFDDIKSIKIYVDALTSSSFNEEDDTLIEEFDTLSGASTILDVEINNNIAAGEGKTFWITVELDETADILADNTTLTLTSITGKDSVEGEEEEKTPGDSNEITATGIALRYFDDIKPAHIFPGAQDVLMGYFIIEAKGDDLEDISLKVTDTNENFLEDKGVKDVYLYRNNGDIENNYTTLDKDTLIDSINDESDDWSNTIVTLNNWNNINLDIDTSYGVWLVYYFDDDIIVTEDSSLKISIGPEDFFGLNSESKETIVTPTYGLFDIPFAGIEITDITDISGDDIYDIYTTIPMISFKLKAHQANVSVNKITIWNNGSIKFYAGNGSAQNIKTLLIYHDSDNSNTFSPQLDSIVGELELKSGNNEKNKAEVIMDVNLDSYTLDQNNAKTFFVVYEVGSNLESENLSTANHVTAEIGTITATGNMGASSILFNASVASNDQPISSPETATVYLEDTVIQLMETEDISNETAYDGEIKVPMLYLKFKATDTQQGSITIKNSANNFYGRAEGITKVWVYADKNSNKQFDKDSDKFMRSSTTFTESDKVILENIQFNNIENEFLILYDVGVLASERKDGNNTVPFSAQLETIEITEGSSTVSGVLPSIESATTTPINNLLETVNLVDNSASSTTPFTFEIKVKNDSAEKIKITKLEPKFYLNDKSGLDISYEFSSTLSSGEVDELEADDEASFIFICEHTIPYSHGIVVIDTYIEYQKEVSPNQQIILTRYEDNLGDWHLISESSVIEKNIVSNMTSAEIPPSYLKHPLTICETQSSGCNSFLDGSSIGANKVLTLEFVDASIIDESTISLIRGTDILYQQEQLEEDNKSFTLDKETNLLKFYTGEKSADITLSMNDLSGNSMPITSLSYLISSSYEVTNPLFYPNPYSLGNNNLQFAYSATKDNTNIQLYIYDHLGKLVFQKNETINSGLNIIAIADTESFMVPGIFICRIIAEEDGVIVASKTTKLAIY